MTITGQVTLTSAAALSGVSVALSGGKSTVATSDSGEFFVLRFWPTGTYTVTPSLAGYAFVPPSQTFTNATANPTANFTAWLFDHWCRARFRQHGGLGSSGLRGGNHQYLRLSLCSTATGATPTLPDRLTACIVQLDGANLHLYYASPSQINAVLPQTLALGAHQLTVSAMPIPVTKRWPLREPPSA